MLFEIDKQQIEIYKLAICVVPYLYTHQILTKIKDGTQQ